jgi:2-C-methyl-D-erythritol 4-phosphate cytidylyltransferase
MEKTMNIALIIAGGFGNRMGQDIPKQFIHINNRPVIVYTLEQFQNHPQIDKIQVVCVEGWQTILRGYAMQFNITKMMDIIPGGDTRFDSIYNGMHSLKHVADEDVIIVHDAVRPLVTSAAISDTIRVCSEQDNSMTVLDCMDTMYLKTEPNFTKENMDRSLLVRGQTPEAVSGKRMRELYLAAEKQGLKIDSISALQVALGWDIHFARGDEKNIKLTTTEDIDLFKALLEIKRDAWLK